MKLRSKLLLAFLFVLLPVLGLLLVGFLIDLRRTRENILETQDLTARSVAIQVADVFDGAIGLGWAVARDPLVQTMDPRVLDAHLRGMVERSPLYESIAVYDAQGLNRGWGDPNQPAEPRVNIRDRAYFQQVMATNTPVISEVLVLKRPKHAGLLASIPIQGPEGRPIGVVNIMMGSGLLTRRYLDARLQQHQEIFLVDSHGRMAFHTETSHLTWRQSNAFADFEPLQRALAGRVARVDSFTSPLVSQEHLGTFVPTPRHPWAVGVSMPVEAALAPLYAEFRLKLLAFAGILLLSGVLAWVLARLRARPIHLLEQAVHSLGRGEMDRRVSLQTGDELEALGSAFNEMADQIVRREAEVKALHQEASRQASLLASIIASVPDAIYFASPDGRLVGTNASGLRLLGLQDASEVEIPLDEYLERYDIRHRDGRPMKKEELPIVRALTGESLTDAEMILRGQDGERKVLSINGAPVRDACGRILFGEIIARDITRRRQQEEELARMFERELALSRISHALAQEVDLSRLAEVIIEQSLLALGAQSCLLWLADAEARQLNLLASHGSCLKDQASLQCVSYDAPFLSAKVARAERGHTIEDLRVGGAGSPFASLLVERGALGMASFPLHSNGRMVGVLTYCTVVPLRLSCWDLEFHTLVGQLFAVALEKARLYQEARDALRLREEFMSAAAHELKSPVTTIQTWSDMLLSKESLTPRQHKGLTAITKNARRMGRLVEHLFSAVKLAPGLPKLERTPFDLHELVREQAEALTQTTECSIQVESTPLLWLDADRSLLAQAVTHLLENAVRYSPPRGEITLCAHVQGDEILVSVRDRGPGIPPERQPHVFEPLYEPLPPGTPGYTNVVGLGLHLSKQIIEAHGGHISLVSSTETGSTFSFRLPRGESPIGVLLPIYSPSGGRCLSMPGRGHPSRGKLSA